MIRVLILAAIVAGLPAGVARGQSAQTTGVPDPDQETFASPEEALAALTAAVASADKPAMLRIFGAANGEIASGDEVADKASYELFAKRLKKMTNLVKQDESTVILYVGAENWPFPFPIARAKDRWFFDAVAGERELFNRRIGENELYTVGVCREYVRAQKEYATEDHDGDDVLEYAQRVNSTPDTEDGLYWPSENGDESPIGSLVANASAEGYKIGNEPQPFHGYLFRILKQQGSSAPGGAYNYVVNGNMIGGFALVAYPAVWGSSGLMTFIVNQQGKVYQKDLGRNTATIAAGMRVYNPDTTWALVDDQ
jgi:hypothetical protein